MSALPFVSIVIPTYNRARLLPLTLDSLLAQDYPADRFEIIVGNNNSADDTEGVLRAYAQRDSRLRYFHEPRQGVHYVRNRAAHLTRGDILYYTDDDMLADKAMLSTLVRAFADPIVGSATGRVLPLWEKTPPAWVTRVMNNGLLSLLDLGDTDIFSPEDMGVYSCHQAMRREAFFKSGGFNPENTAGVWIGDGETGLNLKIKELGYSFAYIAGAVTRHMIPPRRTTQRYLNTRLGNQGNCDAYTAYRKERPSQKALCALALKTLCHPRRGALGSLLKIPWHFFIRRNTDCVRLDCASFFYSLHFSSYVWRLLRDPAWRAQAERNDWLSAETPNGNAGGNDTGERPELKP